MTDPMLKGAEALAALQEIARTPHHMRQIAGDKAADILQMVELYRMALIQNQITEKMLVDVRNALALHKSMALSGELPTDVSERRYKAAMDVLERCRNVEVAKCEKCQHYFERATMKVMDQDVTDVDPKDWKLCCCQCWQAWLQSKLGILRVHANKVIKNHPEVAAECGLTEYEEKYKKQRVTLD